MNCSIIEIFIAAGFAISILLANYAGSKMASIATLEGYVGPKWKLYLGDVALPKEVLDANGLKWRKLSIVSFLFVVAFGLIIGILNSQGSFCFGVDS